MKNIKKPIKKAVSFIIRNEQGDILLIKRPPNDKDLPNVWGLPAGTLKPGESWSEGVIRAGREKLGLDLRVGNIVNEGKLDRKSYTLYMKLFNVFLKSNNAPEVPQPFYNVTQYVDLKWSPPAKTINHLRKTAPKGSLCCTLYLISQNIIDKESAKAWGVKKVI